MRRLFVVVVLMAGLSGTAQGRDAATAAAFTGEFARALQAAMPALSVTVMHDLQLAIRRADRTTASLSLDSAYRDYSGIPSGSNSGPGFRQGARRVPTGRAARQARPLAHRAGHQGPAMACGARRALQEARRRAAAHIRRLQQGAGRGLCRRYRQQHALSQLDADELGVARGSCGRSRPRISGACCPRSRCVS